MDNDTKAIESKLLLESSDGIQSVLPGNKPDEDIDPMVVLQAGMAFRSIDP
jgi:hypothetical protein